MPKRAARERPSPVAGLRARLDEAEATLEAIRTGEVDAVVVSGPGGAQTLAIGGATHPYHVLLNAMNDGAALLDPDGTILFANRRLAEIASVALDALPGSPFHRLISLDDGLRFEGLLRGGASGTSGEFVIYGGPASQTPAWIAFSTVPLESDPGPGATVLMAIVTDLTDRKAAEGTRLELMKRLLSAEDDERRRLARELHDETGQSLTALLVGLRAIEDQAGAADVRSAAQQLRRVAAQTVDNVGRLARGLHPSVLDDMGLAAAARRYVTDYARAFNVAVDLRLDALPSRPLPPLPQTTMYRILQEALTNVARHAGASAVGVELKHDGATLELEIRDDGTGFDVDAAISAASGLGLHGMRERVGLLGGTFDVESKVGKGTVVLARIPTGARDSD